MDNTTAAYMLMNPQARRPSPMQAFSQNFNAGMMAPGAAGGVSIWDEIGDFLNGRARKSKADKLTTGDAKSWMPADENTDLNSSVWGQYSP